MKNLVLLILVGLLSFVNLSAQTDLDKSLSSITTELSTKLKSISKKRVAVMDVYDINKNITTFGKYSADIISVNLVNNAGYFQVVDRQHLDQIMKEHKLNYQGYIDATTAKQLGKILSVDAIIIGTYTVLSNKITLTLKAIDSETAMMLASSMKTLNIDADIAALLGINYAPSTDNSTHTQNNVGTGRGFNSPVQSNEAYNNASTVSSECATQSYGDFCFYNSLNVDISFNYKKSNSKSLDQYSLFKHVILKPKQSMCLYQLPEGVFEYTGRYDDPNNNWGFRDISGQFLVEKCKSKTYTISK